jgi:hypothetical protein
MAPPCKRFPLFVSVCVVEEYCALRRHKGVHRMQDGISRKRIGPLRRTIDDDHVYFTFEPPDGVHRIPSEITTMRQGLQRRAVNRSEGGKTMLCQGCARRFSVSGVMVEAQDDPIAVYLDALS